MACEVFRIMARGRSEELSRKQRQILQFIISEAEQHGYPPSVREIGRAVGLKSTSTVHGHLARLEERGYIRRDPAKPRTIEVLIDRSNQRVKATVGVPVVGKVAAGTPVLAIENIEDYFTLPREFTGEGDLFMLKVRGDSMIEAGIREGDFVVVKQQNSADDGDIVVAMIGGDEATVKRFYRELDHIRLQPENRDLAPIIAKEVAVLGKVVGLLRKFH